MELGNLDVSDMINNTRVQLDVWKSHDKDPIISGFGNYYSQSEYVSELFLKAIDKTEDMLTKKWNLTNRPYLCDSDNALSSSVFLTIDKQYQKSESIGDFLKNNCIAESKKKIQLELEKWINNYGKNYNVSEEQIKIIKENATDILNNNYDKVIDKIRHKDVTEKLRNLCADWDKAYKNFDYDSVKSISNRMKELYSGKHLYRDIELKYDVKNLLHKNELIQNKLDRKEDGKLSEVEEELIYKMDEGNKKMDYEVINGTFDYEKSNNDFIGSMTKIREILQNIDSEKTHNNEVNS